MSEAINAAGFVSELVGANKGFQIAQSATVKSQIEKLFDQLYMIEKEGRTPTQAELIDLASYLLIAYSIAGEKL